MSTYGVKAFPLESKINIRAVSETNDFGKIIKEESSMLLTQLGDQQYLYIKNLGAVVFFNVPEFFQELTKKKLIQEYECKFLEDVENLIVHVSEKQKNAGFNELYIEDLNIDTIHIICLNLSQSVALFKYNDLAENLLENTKKHTYELERSGKVLFRQKPLLKFIGSTLNIKNRISEELFIFNTPRIAWNQEKINQIDAYLNDHLEINQRYSGIKEKLNIIKENLELFKDINLHQHSSRLEWIIILLILFEVVHVLLNQI